MNHNQQPTAGAQYEAITYQNGQEVTRRKIVSRVHMGGPGYQFEYLDDTSVDLVKQVPKHEYPVKVIHGKGTEAEPEIIEIIIPCQH
jgi:hypothetical protein